MSEQEKTVATPSDAAAAMHTGVRLVRTLAGGTDAMRAARETYLPKNEAESKKGYDVRLQRSVLFNAYGKAVEDMVGKVFAKPIVLKDNVPDQIKAYAEDVDLTGTHINVFAKDSFADAMQSGVGYILVDAPPLKSENDSRPATRAETNAAGIRPYLAYIKVERVLGWLSERIAGVETLTQFRFLECVTEPDGAFHVKQIDQIRVIDRDAWRTFRKVKGDDGKEIWQQHDSGANRLGKVSVVPLYTDRCDFMTGKPPLSKLAELNVSHWQLDSDLGNITHVAQVPVLFMAGFDEQDTATIGAAEAIRSNDPNAKVTWIEIQGGSIEAGNKRLERIEQQMQAMGLQMLLGRPGGPDTATGEIREDSKENSPLAMKADGLKDALERALGLMAEYDNLGKDRGGEIEVNKDFGISSMDVPQVIAAFSAGLIDAQTAVNELKRRGFLAESVDAEVVMQRLANSLRLETAAAGNNMNLGT